MRHDAGLLATALLMLAMTAILTAGGVALIVAHDQCDGTFDGSSTPAGGPSYEELCSARLDPATWPGEAFGAFVLALAMASVAALALRFGLRRQP